MKFSKVREEIFRTGLWFLPISFAIAFAFGSIKLAIRQLGETYGSEIEATLSPTEIFHGFLITVIPVVIIFVINMIRAKFFGTTDFCPWERKDVSQRSKDKMTAMKAPVSKEYLSVNPDGFTIGKIGNRYVRLPIDSSNIMHTLVIGAPGSMKSVTLLNALIWNANYAKKEDKMTVFAIDVKPELQRKSVAYDATGKSVKVVNPASADSIYFGWDVYYGLNELSSDDQVEERADLIARSLINCREGAENEIFYNTARNLMVAFLIYGFFSGKGFLDSMLQLMSVPMQDLIAEILTDQEMVKKHPKLRLILQSYEADGKNEMLKDAENTMHEKLRIFGIKSVQYILRDNPKKTSPKDLTDGISIFLSLPDNLLKQYAPLFNLMTQQVLNYLGSIPEWERAERKVPIIWVLIDEFGSIGHMDIEGALARLRSRKVCIWLCVQGLSQLDDTYGQNGRRSIVTDCEATLIFSSKDDVANKFFSEIGGMYKETKISKQRNGLSGISSITQSESTEYRPIFEVSDFVKLRKDKKLIAFVEGHHFYIDKCGYFQIKKLNEVSQYIKAQNDQMMGFQDGDE